MSSRIRSPNSIYDLSIPDDPVLGDPARGMSHDRDRTGLLEGKTRRLGGNRSSRDSHAFDVVDVEQSVLRSNLVIRTLDMLDRAGEAKRARKEMDREVDRIAMIQRALLPPRIPAIQGVVGAADYRTFDRAGGDYYTLLPLDHCEGEEDGGGRWAVIIADASGHGPAAAVLISMLHATLLARPLSQMNAAEVLAYLNRQLLQAADRRFVRDRVLRNHRSRRPARSNTPAPVIRRRSTNRPADSERSCD